LKDDSRLPCGPTLASIQPDLWKSGFPYLGRSDLCQCQYQALEYGNWQDYGRHDE
jgi:hypothetical protein